MGDTVPSVAAEWHFPTRILFGAGRVGELADACRDVGVGRPLVVADAGLVQIGLVESALAGLRSVGVSYGLYSAFGGNPASADVVRGLAVYAEGGHDGVVAFGGGSSIDVAKAIAFASAQTGPVGEYLIGAPQDFPAIFAKTCGDLPAVISVPTTAGTGSEIGRSSAIIDEATGTKKGLFHPRMMPQVCIADPELTLGLGGPATAAFGMDALSHSLEAYCCSGFHPSADGCALRGIKLVRDWLPRAVADGSDIQARAQVMAASLAGGVAFQKGVGGAHALAHPLSSRLGMHHGLAVGIVLPYVVAFNGPSLDEPLTALARYIGLAGASPTAVVEWLVALRATVGIPHTLRDAGIAQADVAGLAALAATDIAVLDNPVRLGERETLDLYMRAFAGEVR